MLGYLEACVSHIPYVLVVELRMMFLSYSKWYITVNVMETVNRWSVFVLETTFYALI